MASCEELFQRKLDLDLRKQANDEDLTRINQIRASRSRQTTNSAKPRRLPTTPWYGRTSARSRWMTPGRKRRTTSSASWMRRSRG